MLVAAGEDPGRAPAVVPYEELLAGVPVPPLYMAAAKGHVGLCRTGAGVPRKWRLPWERRRLAAARARQVLLLLHKTLGTVPSTRAPCRQYWTYGGRTAAWRRRCRRYGTRTAPGETSPARIHVIRRVTRGSAAPLPRESPRTTRQTLRWCPADVEAAMGKTQAPEGELPSGVGGQLVWWRLRWPACVGWRMTQHRWRCVLRCSRGTWAWYGRWWLRVRTRGYTVTQPPHGDRECGWPAWCRWWWWCWSLCGDGRTAVSRFGLEVGLVTQATCCLAPFWVGETSLQCCVYVWHAVRAMMRGMAWQGHLLYITCSCLRSIYCCIAYG